MKTKQPTVGVLLRLSPETHLRLKQRAAERHMSVQRFLRIELDHLSKPKEPEDLRGWLAGHDLLAEMRADLEQELTKDDAWLKP